MFDCTISNHLVYSCNLQVYSIDHLEGFFLRRNMLRKISVSQKESIILNYEYV